MINETGCYPVASSDSFEKEEKQTFDILWVGKFGFRKQLILALKTISEIKDLNIQFHIAGGSQYDNEVYQVIVSDLGMIANKCTWHGIVPIDKFKS